MEQNLHEYGHPRNGAAQLKRPQTPLRPGGSIRFDLARAAHVRVEIVDMEGRAVETLVDERRTAGEHAAVWTADGCESGVYCCVLSVDGDSARRKVVLLR